MQKLLLLIPLLFLACTMTVQVPEATPIPNGTPTPTPTPLPDPDFVLLEHLVLGSNVAAIDIQNISQGFEHLRIYFLSRTDHFGTTNLMLRLNNDTGNNYDYQHMQVLGTTVSGLTSAAASNILLGSIHAENAAANRWGVFTIDIPNYTSNQHKRVIATNSHIRDATTSNFLMIKISAGWRNTDSIDRVTLSPLSGNFLAGTVISIYGLQGN
jgi:hypothetical protein